MILPAALHQPPLAGLLLTLTAFQCGMLVYQRSGRHVLLQPFLLAWIPVVACIKLDVLALDAYNDSTAWLRFLLGPATVSLAVPLYRHSHAIARHATVLVLTIVSGAFTATALAWTLAKLGGANTVILLSVLPKTVTTPIAMQVASAIGGWPAIAAGTVALTGVAGAVCGPWLFDRLGIDDPRVRGLALGLAAHAVGTARAFDESPQTGAYASLGLGLTGLLVAFVLPFIGPHLV
jgi:predicted murein hydrolase (TIGR00659 family)